MGRGRKVFIGGAVGLALLAGIGWPITFNFVHFATRAKGAEARSNLKKLCVSQRDLSIIERGNRYAYFVAADAVGRQVDLEKYGAAVSLSDLPATFAGGMKLGDNPSNWCLAAVGNLDADPALDVWSVSTADRTAADGARIPACEAFHDRDDVGTAFGFLRGE